MKKVVRMLGLCALVALVFTSCKKDETKTVTFKATINQPTYANSRTHIEGSSVDNLDHLFWNENDEIKVIHIGSGAAEDYKVQASKFFEDYAEFEGDPVFLGELSTPAAYTAFYPFTQPLSEYDGANVFLTIPDQQVHYKTTFDNNTFPMFGHNDASGNFQFESHAGLLKLQLRSTTEDEFPHGAYGTTIGDIVISAPNDVLAGTMQYQPDGSYDGIDMTRPYFDEITMLTGGKTVYDDDLFIVYAVLPEGALANGFTVTIYATDGITPLQTLQAGPSSDLEEGLSNTISAGMITVMPRIYLPHD